MAEILLARQNGETRPVVIKRIVPFYKDDEHYVAMFEQEIEITRRLAHPNLPRCLAVGRHGGFHYLILEWIDGVSLERLLHAMEERRLPINIVVYIAS